MIPYINRTLDLLLPDVLEVRDINVRKVIDEFCRQCENFFHTFEAFVYIAPGCRIIGYIFYSGSPNNLSSRFPV